MIARLIEYCIRGRFVVLILTAAVAIWGLWCVLHTPVDAIPDLSENQVIVFTDWVGQAPQEIDDQVTYPLSVDLKGLPGVKAVRSTSEFGFSMITVIFDDSTDFYFARTRVQERLSAATTYLPAGVIPYMAPDATALGQIFWYTVEGDGYSLDELRAVQDFFVRYQLYVEGVAQVASVGGFVRQYQVDVTPQRLRELNLPLGAVVEAVQNSNLAAGGKVIVEAGAEYLIRGVGWLRDQKDLENVVVAQRGGVPIFLRDVAKVQLGPAFRRSIIEKDGREVTGGVVMMRYGANPLEVTRAIKDRIEQLQAGLPKGVRIVPFYDRTRLITGAIHTLKRTLIEELLIASLAILLILMHFRSALVVCLTLPLAVLVSFILMYYLDIPSNIMSLSGIAISIGILVDAAVVMVENATHELKLQYGEAKVRGDTTETVVRACRLVGKPIFFAVLIMLLSFLPIFALSGIQGKMFRPLAFTKTFAMIGVAVLAVTFVPAIIPVLVKGRLRGEEESWLVRSFINIYKPVLGWLMRVPAAAVWLLAFLLLVGLGMVGVIAPGRGVWMYVVAGAVIFFGAAFFRRLASQFVAVALLLATMGWAWHLPKLGWDRMPPLDEGSVLDMPVTSPRVSLAQAGDDLKVRDQVLRSFPEVEQVVGKDGRAETATDPSGLEMVETIVNLRPPDLWPRRKVPFEDAVKECRSLLADEQQRGLIKRLEEGPAEGLANAATMESLFELDQDLRELCQRRQTAFEPVLAGKLSRQTLDDLVDHIAAKGLLTRRPAEQELAALADSLTKEHGIHLLEGPRQEEMNAMLSAAVAGLVALGAAGDSPQLLEPRRNAWTAVRDAVGAALGERPASFARDEMDRWEERHDSQWRQRMKVLDWEIEDQAPGRLLELLAAKLVEHARTQGMLAAEASKEDLKKLCDAREPALRKGLFLTAKTKSELVEEMNSDLQVAGWSNIWTQPIINRVNMLATGVRTQIGVKVYGSRLDDVKREVTRDGRPTSEIDKMGIQSVANEVAAALKTVPGAVDISADQVMGRSYVRVDIDRERAARYGVNVSEVQQAVETAAGGKTVTNTIEGRRRFAVQVRYARDDWQTERALRNILVTGRREGGGGEAAAGAEGPSGGETKMQVPLTEVADIRVEEGPSTVKSEDGLLRAYVMCNVRGRDLMGFVEEARRTVADRLDALRREGKLAPGTYVEWTGEFEHELQTARTLAVVFPAVVVLIFVVLLFTFNDWRDAALILCGVAGALVGGVIFQSLFGFHFSVAVGVGYVACFGMAAQTGIVMLVYIHEAIRAKGGLAAIATRQELTDTIIRGAVHRLRPKLMTEGVAILGLMPMLWASGIGAEVMRPMAAPVLGGLLIADEVIDLLLPILFNWYQGRRWAKIHAAAKTG